MQEDTKINVVRYLAMFLAGVCLIIIAWILGNNGRKIMEMLNRSKV